VEAAPPAPALPWPPERSRTLEPDLAVSLVALEPLTVEVRLRAVARVDTLVSTATPGRRFLTTTVREGSP